MGIMMKSEENTKEIFEKPNSFRENYLLFQLAFVSHMFSEDFHSHLREQGISPSKWRILININEQPGIRITRLARNTLFDQPRVTKMVDQLCQDGLVVKSMDMSDRRRVHLNLTRKGEGILAPLMTQAISHESDMLSALDPGDADRLKSILTKLVKPYLNKVNKSA